MNVKNKKTVKMLIERLVGGEIDQLKKFRKGTINHNYTFYYSEVLYFAKIPLFRVSDWETEKKVYEKLDKNVKYDVSTGLLVRPWIKADPITSWNLMKLESLQKEIGKLHRVKVKGVGKHNWSTYDKHLDKIYMEDVTFFKKNRDKYSKDPLVLSHNDIHMENVLWDKKKRKVHLLDFEWSSMASDYFDFASFYINDGIKLKAKNTQKLNNYIYMTLVYFVLWTYDVQQTSKVKKLRKKYKKLLKAKSWLD